MTGAFGARTICNFSSLASFSFFFLFLPRCIRQGDLSYPEEERFFEESEYEQWVFSEVTLHIQNYRESESLLLLLVHCSFTYTSVRTVVWVRLRESCTWSRLHPAINSCLLYQASTTTSKTPLPIGIYVRHGRGKRRITLTIFSLDSGDTFSEWVFASHPKEAYYILISRMLCKLKQLNQPNRGWQQECAIVHGPLFAPSVCTSLFRDNARHGLRK